MDKHGKTPFRFWCVPRNSVSYVDILIGFGCMYSFSRLTWLSSYSGRCRLWFTAMINQFQAQNRIWNMSEKLPIIESGRTSISVFLFNDTFDIFLSDFFGFHFIFSSFIESFHSSIILFRILDHISQGSISSQEWRRVMSIRKHLNNKRNSWTFYLMFVFLKNAHLGSQSFQGHLNRSTKTNFLAIFPILFEVS